MSGAIIEACDYHGPYPGTFIPTLLAVGSGVRDRLGLEHVLVFPAEVRDRPWVQLVRATGVEPVFVPANTGARAAAILLRDLARERGGRLVRSHFTRFDVPAGVAARTTGMRTVWNIHTGTLVYDLRHRARDIIKVRLLGSALCDRVLAVSEEIGREARMRGYRRVSVVLNGIDVARFERLPERAAARSALGLAGERVLLAFCWTPFRKGADVIAAACAQLDGVVALLVGDAELTAYLRDRLGEPFPPWLRIVPPVDDVRDLLAAADAFISASREEAFSYAIGEAMAAGLPVVSSDIPGPRTYFDAPELRTYPPEDPAALARALRELPAPPAEGNRRFVAERLGLDRHVDGVLTLFERELSRGRRAR